MDDHRAMVRLHVTGRVQGVGFRRAVAREAVGLGLSGYVRNLPGGDVEIEAEGPADDLASLADFCAHGPPGARVDDVHIAWGPSGAHSVSFEVY